MSACVREVFFADTGRGARFCLLTRPSGSINGRILFVHPFAEEMNKSRRMVALAVRAFAEEGWAVLQVDLAGCGDSEGDFGDATWEAWIADMTFGWNLLLERCGKDVPGVVWGLRGGNLLIADWMVTQATQPAWLMWQPVTNGRLHLTQFLRLKAANEMLGDADARTAMTRIRASLKQERAVEIAGYEISPALAMGMDASAVRMPNGYQKPLAVVEISMAEPLSPSPAVTLAADKWRDAGMRVDAHVVRGAAFWQTQEIEVVPEAIGPSVKFLRMLAE